MKIELTVKVIGYVRVSTDQQDIEQQKHLLLEYAQANQLLINEFVECEVSSKKEQRHRRIGELLEKLETGDTLIVAELSRIGRNMLETMSIVNSLMVRDVKVVFVRQPELSTSSLHSKLLLAIYSYIAETERDYISIRTKQALAAIKAAGGHLGRPKGSRNKNQTLDLYKDQIEKYLRLKINVHCIMKIINNQLKKPMTYNAYRYFIQYDKDLHSITETI